MKPRCVVAFAGHMIDHSERETARFPPAAEPAVRARIRNVLRNSAPAAVVSSAASGGDIIVAEEALALDTPLYIILPFEDRDDFVGRSVAYAGSQWAARFRRVCRGAAHPPFFVKSGAYTHDRNYEDNQRALLFFAMGVAVAMHMPLNSLVLCDEAQLGDQIGGTRSFLALCRDLRIPYEVIDIAGLR